MRISDWSSDVCSSDLAGITRSLPSGLSPSAQAFHLICSTLPSEGARGLATDAAYRRWGLPPRPENTENSRWKTTGWQYAGKRFRSEERRVGQEWLSTCRSRWSPSHEK